MGMIRSESWRKRAARQGIWAMASHSGQRKKDSWIYQQCSVGTYLFRFLGAYNAYLLGLRLPLRPCSFSELRITDVYGTLLGDAWGIRSSSTGTSDSSEIEDDCDFGQRNVKPFVNRQCRLSEEAEVKRESREGR